MKKISKIRELALIICVLVLMKGIVSYAADASVLLYADQKSASSASITVTNYNVTIWGSVSSGSGYGVDFVVPDGPYSYACVENCLIGKTLGPIVRGVYYTTSTNLILYGNSKDDPKKGCIASGGIAD